jgi:hypothetical protein
VRLGSISFAVTLAMFVSVLGVVAVTTIVTVALVLFPRLPRLQLIVPSLGDGFDVDRLQTPWLG